jgi:S1-C subfamily serine protease
LAVNSGALVTVVLEGSAAEAAGIQIDDVLVGVNGASIASGNELRNRVGLMHPGDEVEIELVRDGRRMTQTAVLGRRPAANEVVGETGIEDDTLFDGVVLVETQFAGVAGLAVASIAPDSPAAAQGLAEGDLITNINRQRVSTLAEARAIVSSARVVVAQIRRGNREVLIRLR